MPRGIFMPTAKTKHKQDNCCRPKNVRNILQAMLQTS